MTTFNVTKIQFFDTSFQRQVGEDEFEIVKRYSANVIINNEFVLEVAGNEVEAEKPTFSDCCFVSTEEVQEAASEKYDIDEVIEQIEASGFENNYSYLEVNGESM